MLGVVLTTSLSLMKCYYLIIPYRIFVGMDTQLMGCGFWNMPFYSFRKEQHYIFWLFFWSYRTQYIITLGLEMPPYPGFIGVDLVHPAHLK